MEEENAKKHSGVLGKIFLVILGLITIYIIDWGFLRNEITDYTIDCPPSFGGCYTLRFTRYKIDKRNQKVIYWTQGFPPNTVTNCTILNRRNWKCRYDDESAEFGFSGGEYYEISLEPSEIIDELTKHQSSVSRLEYLNLQWFPDK